jgi:hypothetical protein
MPQTDVTAHHHSAKHQPEARRSGRPGVVDTQRGVHGRRGRPMSDDEIRSALARFLKGQTRWPTYREFERAGLKAVRDRVTQRGGARHWAHQLGVAYIERPPGYAPIWTEERIRKQLRTYLAGTEEWPSRKQFEADGEKPLRDAVNRTGGADRWAAEFGLPRSTRLSGIRRGWTPDRIDAHLRELIGDSRRWPSRDEFYAAGLGGMLGSIYAHEGPTYWAQRFGVQTRLGSGRPTWQRWTEERIQDELTQFCAGRVAWPTEREFIAAGRRALYAAASRQGGIARWATALGLPRARSRLRSPPATQDP